MSNGWKSYEPLNNFSREIKSPRASGQYFLIFLNLADRSLLYYYSVRGMYRPAGDCANPVIRSKVRNKKGFSAFGDMGI